MGALSQGGQALNVDSEESAEGVGLGLAQLGKFSSNVLDRAVALTQLDADGVVSANRTGGGSVALAAQCGHEGLGPSEDILPRLVDLGADALLQSSDPLVGEGAHGVLAGTGTQEVHDLGGDLVVLGDEVVVTGITDDPLPGGATAATLARVGSPAGDSPVLGQLVEVATHSGGGEAQLARDVGRRDGAELTDHRQNALPGARITRIDVGFRRRRDSRRIKHTPMLRNY